MQWDQDHSLSSAAEMAGLAAFGGALAIHFAAVAIAAIKPQEQIDGPAQTSPKRSSRCRSESTNRSRPSRRLRRRKNRPRHRRPRPFPKSSRSLWRKSRPRRPSGRLRTKPVAPIARPKPAGPIGPDVHVSAKAVAIFSAPRPEYPYEARRSKITGSGVCRHDGRSRQWRA